MVGRVQGKDMERWFPLRWVDLVPLGGIASLVFTIMKEFGITGWIAGSIAAFLYILVVTLWSIARLWSSMENRFRLVPARPGGEEAYKEIRGHRSR